MELPQKEFQARLADHTGSLDLPIEARTPAVALMKAIKAQSCIQERFFAHRHTDLYINEIVEVIRHDRDFIEHQPVWTRFKKFIDRKGN